MKILKRIVIYFLILLIASPFITYIGIVITNNSIAHKAEKALVAYKLPQNTELIDSISIAGKLTGNGNGMQYMGSILVASDLSEERLKEYYDAEFGYVEVRKQDSPTIDFIHSKGCSFKGFSKNGNNYYSITYWENNRKEKYGALICELLDIDIRGH